MYDVLFNRNGHYLIDVHSNRDFLLVDSDSLLDDFLKLDVGFSLEVDHHFSISWDFHWTIYHNIYNFFTIDIDGHLYFTWFLYDMLNWGTRHWHLYYFLHYFLNDLGNFYDSFDDARHNNNFLNDFLDFDALGYLHYLLDDLFFGGGDLFDPFIVHLHGDGCFFFEVDGDFFFHDVRHVFDDLDRLLLVEDHVLDDFDRNVLFILDGLNEGNLVYFSFDFDLGNDDRNFDIFLDRSNLYLFLDCDHWHLHLHYLNLLHNFQDLSYHLYFFRRSFDDLLNRH